MSLTRPAAGGESCEAGFFLVPILGRGYEGKIYIGLFLDCYLTNAFNYDISNIVR